MPFWMSTDALCSSSSAAVAVLSREEQRRTFSFSKKEKLL